MGRYDRPAWPVLTCGRFFDEVTDWEAEYRSMSPGLTPEEEASRYAKYYYMKQAVPTPENILAAERGNPLPQDAFFLPEDLVKEMASGRAETLRSGYLACPDGTGFAVARIRGEGITEEMVQYFCDYFKPEGDLYYKIWVPGAHMRHFNDAAIEDVGSGMEVVRFMSFVGPADLGLTDDLTECDPKCITLSGGNGVSWPLHAIGQYTRKALSIRYTREIENGRETIMLFWHGLHLINGRSEHVIPEYTVTEEDVRIQVSHCIREQQQEYALIRAFWEDRKTR